MLKVIKRTFPLAKEGEINRLKMELENEKQRNNNHEEALSELAQKAADQEDAIVELADLIM